RIQERQDRVPVGMVTEPLVQDHHDLASVAIFTVSKHGHGSLVASSASKITQSPPNADPFVWDHLPAAANWEMDRFPARLSRRGVCDRHDWRRAVCSVTSPMADLIVHPF